MILVGFVIGLAMGVMIGFGCASLFVVQDID